MRRTVHHGHAPRQCLPDAGSGGFPGILDRRPVDGPRPGMLELRLAPAKLARPSVRRDARGAFVSANAPPLSVTRRTPCGRRGTDPLGGSFLSRAAGFPPPREPSPHLSRSALSSADDHSGWCRPHGVRGGSRKRRHFTSSPTLYEKRGRDKPFDHVPTRGESLRDGRCLDRGLHRCLGRTRSAEQSTYPLRADHLPRERGDFTRPRDTDSSSSSLVVHPIESFSSSHNLQVVPLCQGRHARPTVWVISFPPICMDTATKKKKDVRSATAEPKPLATTFAANAGPARTFR